MGWGALLCVCGVTVLLYTKAHSEYFFLSLCQICRFCLFSRSDIVAILFCSTHKSLTLGIDSVH